MKLPLGEESKQITFLLALLNPKCWKHHCYWWKDAIDGMLDDINQEK